MCVCVCVFCAAYMRVHTRLEKKNVQTCSCDLKKKGKRKKRTGNHGSYVNEGKGKKKQYNSPQNGGSTRLRCKRRNKVQSVMLISGSLRKAVTVLLRHTHTHMRLSKCEKKKALAQRLPCRGFCLSATTALTVTIVSACCSRCLLSQLPTPLLFADSLLNAPLAGHPCT